MSTEKNAKHRILKKQKIKIVWGGVNIIGSNFYHFRNRNSWFNRIRINRFQM